jgi:hypothetical protein
MKTLTTLTAVAALIAGMSIASAQNSGGTGPATASPSNINKSGGDVGTGTSPTSKSGSEGSAAAKSSAAMKKDKQVTGNGKFCIEMSEGGALECKFASLEACVKEGKPNSRQCQPNPKLGTTGSK